MMKELLKTMANRDTGFISAYRSEYTKEQNQQRNRSLLAKLQAKRYRTFSVEGIFIENYGPPDQKELGEDFILVVDFKATGKLRDDLEALGKEFDQDSIIFISKEGKNAFITGTSAMKDVWPGLCQVITIDKSLFRRNRESLVNISDQPFIVEEHKLPEGFMGRMACKEVANFVWWKFPI